jgi:hypothetical protein
MVDEDHLEEQIERCRRLASMLTDEQMRRSLEELADQYEARLKHKGNRNGKGAGFMLQRKRDSA